ncbi:unnamed protein product [Schistocephalus solidus]|uniref:C2H2-type domain-containing protein n=1 Tax=Schistocephalus solidus TaxID=70667 RepID=A0A183SRW5_SCHSO|nr:unnamed protein product [Schistocephalus solidus]
MHPGEHRLDEVLMINLIEPISGLCVCVSSPDSPTLTPGINSISPTIIETTSQCSARVTLTTTTTATTTTTISHGNSLLNCPHCDRTFTSRIGLVDHLRIHRTETGEPVPGAPTHSRDHHLHFFHCLRAFTHRVSLFGHIPIHDSGINRNAANTDYPCTPSAPAILTATATPTTMNAMPQPLPISPAHTAPTTHASAWSVTCESIARRLMNQLDDDVLFKILPIQCAL